MSKITKSHNDPEAVAIAAITKAIADIPDERKLAVLKFVHDRLGGRITTESQKLDSILALESEGKESDIKTFLKNKKPVTPYQQVAVLAYFLKKNRSTESVNKKLIEDANKEALGRSIDDITGVLNDAKNKYQFFVSGSGGKKLLSAHGEDVVNALPEQAKVAQLMKEFGKKKRRRKQAPKRTKK